MKTVPEQRHMIAFSRRGEELLEERYGVRNHPGYFGAFTTREQPGYLPNGARVRKAKEDPSGDMTPLGTLGTVMGSFEHPQVGGGYFVEWDNCPRRVSFSVKWKVEEMK